MSHGLRIGRGGRAAYVLRIGDGQRVGQSIRVSHGIRVGDGIGVGDGIRVGEGIRVGHGLRVGRGLRAIPDGGGANSGILWTIVDGCALGNPVLLAVAMLAVGVHLTGPTPLGADAEDAAVATVGAVVAVHAHLGRVGKLSTRHAGHRARGVEHDEHVCLVKLPFDHNQGIDARLGDRG
jgi:hypothetical protein